MGILMSVAIAIIGAVFAFFIVVMLHELGHFVVARALGIKVFTFSIGFGKAIWSHRAKSGVNYVVGFLPLGGYVRMWDDASQETLLAKKTGSKGTAFQSKSVFARMAVVLAGPFINFILALFLFWIIFLMGVTYVKPIVGEVLPQSIAAKARLQSGDQIVKMGAWPTDSWQAVMMSLIMHMGHDQPLLTTVLPKDSFSPLIKKINLHGWDPNLMGSDIIKSLGILPYFPKIDPIISSISLNSPASKTQLQPGDLILSVNGQKILAWKSLVQLIHQHPNKQLIFTVQRDNRIVRVPVQLGQKRVEGRVVGFLGVMPKHPKIPDSLLVKTNYSVFSAWAPACRHLWRLIVFHAVVLKRMIQGKVSLKSLGGPITIFHAAGSASLAGLKVYLRFLAFISLVLGFINLLPIPGLDGGHFLFCLIEGIFRRPLPRHLQLALTALGIGFLVFIMLLAIVNDVFRLM